MSINTIDLLMALSIFLMTILSGAIPFAIKVRQPKRFDFPISEAIANGVFLGAGLMHMLYRSALTFSKLGFHLPIAFFICGATFLFFLLSEHLGFFMKKKNTQQSVFIALITTFMLSVHSFFAGAALGITSSISLSVILFVAILAHKWAASFSLAVYINKTHMSIQQRVGLFSLFSIMVPLGIYCGDLLHQHYLNNVLIQPIFTAIAAGTFIYLGTLHGFKKILTQEGCCQLHHYYFVLLGFILMAASSIWL